MKYGPFLKSFRLENFKAIQNSKSVKLTPQDIEKIAKSSNANSSSG